VRSIFADDSKGKIKKTGRHKAPSPLRKVARRAGKAAPAVAVVGALAAVPQVRALAFSQPAAAGHQAAEHQTIRHHTSGQHAAERRSASQQVAASDTIMPVRLGIFPRARPATTARVSGTARSAKATTPNPSPSASPAASASQQGSAAAPSGPGSGGPGTGGQGAGGQAAGTPVCSGGGGMLPANYAAIVDFLTAHGYTGIAAAGIAGNIYQESMGNPESVGSGGGGLIGWTPLPAGFVTGNPAADLQTQLAAILTFNQQWAQYLPALNAATSPAQAADIYVTDFERAGIPAFGNREAAAQAVAAACGL
jgi:hypothetical protein